MNPKIYLGPALTIICKFIVISVEQEGTSIFFATMMSLLYSFCLTTLNIP